MNRFSRCVVFIFLLTLETVQTHAVSQVQTTWLGNTFGGKNHEHVQNQVGAMTVASDGTIYTNSGWDEDGSESSIYKDGARLGACGDLHGWGRHGGSAVTADENYVYVAMSQDGDDGADSHLNANKLANYPPPKNIWYCIRRYDRGGHPAPFPTGYGIDSSLLKIGSSSLINGDYPDMGISGLATANGKLYASDHAHGRILIYNTNDLSLSATWPCAGCQSLAVDAENNIWVCINSGPKVIELGSDGQRKAATLTFAPTSVLSALAYRAANHRLYIADSGPDQDIKGYSIADLSGQPTKPQDTLGTKGGIFAGTGTIVGAFGAYRFNQPSGIGFDRSGNTYVASTGSASGGGSVIECYDPNGKRTWVLYGLEFVDTAEPDPASENDVFTAEEHFTMDYATTTPGTEWRYQGYTINRFKYPDDPRRHIAMTVAWVRNIAGHRFLFTSDMYAGFLAVTRFDPETNGETGIPSVLFAKEPIHIKNSNWPPNQPAAGEWIWRDGNGNGTQDKVEYASTGADSPIKGWGWWVDSCAGVWQCSGAGIRHFICQGLDEKGNPIYDYAANHVVTAKPPPLPEGVSWNDLLRIRYFPTAQDGIPADTMFVSGYTSQWPDNTAHWWGSAGRVVYRYDKWSTATVIHPGYPIVLPSDTSIHPETVIQGIDICGKYLFAGRSRDPQPVIVYDIETGHQVTTLTPGDAVGGPGSTGWLDIREPIHAYKRGNGEYLIFVEEDWKAKVLLYRWNPRD